MHEGCCRGSEQQYVNAVMWTARGHLMSENLDVIDERFKSIIPEAANQSICKSKGSSPVDG